MQDKKNQYIKDASICIVIIAVVFIIQGIFELIAGSLWGLMELGFGLLILVVMIIKFTKRSKLRKIVLNEFNQNPDITGEKISTKTGISLQDVEAIIIDLKWSRKTRDIFSQKLSGDEV